MIPGPDTKPIRPGQLRQEQSADLRSLRQEFAGHPSRGLTPARLAAILQSAEQGDLVEQMELFEDMEEKDAHLFAEMSKRKRALLGLDWKVDPPRNATAQEQKTAVLVQELLLGIPNFEDVLLGMADAIGKGFACLEMTWAQQGGAWLPDQIALRPQTWFTVGREDRDALRLRDGSAEGAVLKPFGWITHVHKAKEGYLSRAGLHRVLAWPFLFKNYSVRDLAEFLEIYGLPLRLGTYPGGATEEEKLALLRAVTEIGHRAAGIIPSGMAIEFKEAAKGEETPFTAMITWAEMAMSKAILGGTLTTQADGKSSTNALGNVHNEVRHDLLVSDARQIAATLTSHLLLPLAALNAPGVGGGVRPPVFVFDTRQPEDLLAFAEAIPKLVGTGLKIPAGWVLAKLGIPQAQEGEETLAPPAASQPVAAPTPATGQAEAKATPQGAVTLATGGAGQADVADQFEDRLDAEAAPLAQEMVDRVKALVAGAGSFEEIQTGLLGLLGGTEGFQEKLAQAFVAAELSGRYEALTGEEE